MSQATLTAIPCLTLPAGELTAAELSSLPLAKPSSKSKNPRESKQPREAKHPQQVAEEFHATLKAVNEGAIPVMSRDRHIP